MEEKATEIIRVKPSTKKYLDEVGNKNDSYDDVLKRELGIEKEDKEE